LTTYRRLAILFLTISMQFATHSSALARGFACAQDCASGSCVQASCLDAVGNGFYTCSSGSVPWAESGSLSWCTASSQRPTSAASPTGVSELLNSSAMETAISVNPFVATIVSALRDDSQWAAGPVEGFLHSTQYDPASGSVSHSRAIRFNGVVAQGGVGAVEFQINLSGADDDFASLLVAYPNAEALPASVHGLVTDGALHGRIQITTHSGKPQVVEW